MPLKASSIILSFFCMAQISAAKPAIVENQTMYRKVLMGYQGWFACPEDGSPLGHGLHWLKGDASPPKLNVEMWPDTREFDEDELFPTPWKMPDGSPAKLFSSYHPKTVARHFQWMKDAGIDGVLLQRFIGEVQDPRFFQFRNEVTRHVMKGAVAHGRVFAIEYDMSAEQSDKVLKDWKYMVDELGITRNSRYLHHKGKPVICLWGLGFTHREGDAAKAQILVNWLRSGAPKRYQATVVGGVPTGWRTASGDSKPGEEWAKLYRSLDVISPWTVGRYKNEMEATSYAKDVMVPDMIEARKQRIDYLPVIYPGFAWSNLHDGPPNQIPRNGGRFYWSQVYNAMSSGAVMMKVAMFDEVDEATAMFKTAPTAQQAPVGIHTLTLDADDESLPSDWYLRLGGETSRALRGEISVKKELPIQP